MKRDADDEQSKVLSPSEWRRLDSAVDRALAWLATQQQQDGSFPTLTQGQPGVTSLCVLAFMAHGHEPGRGAVRRTTGKGDEVHHVVSEAKRARHAEWARGSDGSRAT